MHLTLALMGRWPASCKNNMREFSKHVQENCDIIEDVYSSSIIESRALLDSVGDGNIVKLCSKHNFKTILIWYCNEAEPERQSIEQLSTMYDENIRCDDIIMLINSYKSICEQTDKHFITLIIASQPTIGYITNVQDQQKSAASVITQVLAAREAIQYVNQLFEVSSNTNFICTAYHAVEFRKNMWKNAAESFAIVTKTLQLQNELTTPELLVKNTLKSLDILPTDLKKETVKNVTLYENNEHIERVICRVMITNSKYELIASIEDKSLPIQELPLLFQDITPNSFWRVKDPKSIQENLLDDDKWIESEEYSILKTECASMIDSIVKRRLLEEEELSTESEELSQIVKIQGEDEVEIHLEETEMPEGELKNDNEEDENIESGEPDNVILNQEINDSAEPMWLQNAVDNLEIDIASDSTDKSSNLYDFASWKDKIKDCITREFGFENMQYATHLIDKLNPVYAYTMIFSNEDIIVLYGSFPPRCFQIITTCIDENNHIHRVYTSKNEVRVGKKVLDINSYKQCDSVAMYHTSQPNTVNNTVLENRKGAVKRLETKRQLGKLLAGY